MKTISKILIVVLALNMATSCKKIKQRKPIIVNLEVINPVTKKGYENLRWFIYELEDEGKLLSGLKATLFMEGKTDANGKARIEFKRPMSKKLHYNLRLDVTSLPIDIETSESSWNLEDKTEQDITAYASEKVNFVLHIKNTNCFDADDKAFTQSPIIGINFNSKILFEGEIGFGCFDHFLTVNGYEDYYPYTLEVTRNSVTTITHDTLLLTKDIDTLNLFY